MLNFLLINMKKRWHLVSRLNKRDRDNSGFVNNRPAAYYNDIEIKILSSIVVPICINVHRQRF